jgi:hypothetical protein
MKKLLLCFSIVLILSNVKAQTVTAPQSVVPSNNHPTSTPIKRQGSKMGTLSAVWKPIAERTDNYNSVNKTWTPSDSGSYYYDANANDTATYYYQYASGAWNNYYVTYTNYDANEHVLASGQRDWLSYLNAWRNETQNALTYSAAGDTTAMQYQSWDTVAEKWDGSSNTLYHYDANHNDTDEIAQIWDNVSGAFQNADQWKYTYTAKGSPATYQWQLWERGAWKDSMYGTTTYDANNNKTQSLDQIWNAATGKWDNYDRYTYTYGDTAIESYYLWDDTTSAWNPQWTQTIFKFPNKTIYINEGWNSKTASFENTSKQIFTDNTDGYLNYQEFWNWNDSVWVPNSTYIYAFYNGNDSIVESSYSGDSVNGAWTTEWTTTTVYDANNNLTFYSQVQNYGPGNGYVFPDRTFYYYKSFNSDVASEVKNELNASIFPNPLVANEATLNVNYDEASEVAIHIYDMQGNMISASTRAVGIGSNNIDLPIRNMSSGDYFLQVVDQYNGKTSVLKLTKE